MHFVLLNLGDRFHHISIFFLVSSVIICLTAEMLIGSRFCRNVGSLFFWLEPCSDAALARAPALSFPIESLCPAIQVNDISELELLSFSSSIGGLSLISWCRSSSICCSSSLVHLWISSIMW